MHLTRMHPHSETRNKSVKMQKCVPTLLIEFKRFPRNNFDKLCVPRTYQPTYICYK